MAPAARGLPALQGPRRRGDPPPLRRLQPLLRAGPRPVDDLHLRGASRPRTPPSRRRRTFKYDLVARKLGLQPGMRLLDIGCGWGGMVRHAAKHYGVEVVGVTLSREQAAWAQAGDQARGPRRRRRGAVRRLPRRAGHRLRRGQLDRPDRAHRRPQLPVVLRVPAGQAGARAAGCSTTASPGRTTPPRTPAPSSTATSSPTASSPARAGSSPRSRTSGSRCGTRRTSASTTR